MNDPHLRAWRTFLESYAHAVRQLERELADECQLPLTWYDVLVQLHEADGSMRVGELADRLLISRSATTRFVDRLERAGLIERRIDATDRRGTWVVLTAVGIETLRKAAPTHLRGIEQHFSSKLSSAEAEQLSMLLAKLGSDHS